MRLKALLLLSTIAFFSCRSLGQSAQATKSALFRTFMIETNVGRGTAFSIDVDNREYWITAKHMFTGVKTGPAGVFTTKRSKQTFSRRSAMAMRATICIG
jgi:hypothetical protein